MRRLLVLTCAMIFVDTVFYATLVPPVPYFTEEPGRAAGAGVVGNRSVY